MYNTTGQTRGLCLILIWCLVKKEIPHSIFFKYQIVFTVSCTLIVFRKQMNRNIPYSVHSHFQFISLEEKHYLL